MKRLLILNLLIFIYVSAFAQGNQRTILLNKGPQNTWERDLGYSPLVYKGGSIGFTLGYTTVGEKKTDEVYIHYSRLPLQSEFNAKMNATHASVITYTFYKADWLPKKFTLGWSNNNALSIRNYEDVQNFNPSLISTPLLGLRCVTKHFLAISSNGGFPPRPIGR